MPTCESNDAEHKKGRRGRDSTRKGALTKPGRVCCSEQCGEAEPDSLNAGLLGHSGLVAEGRV